MICIHFQSRGRAALAQRDFTEELRIVRQSLLRLNYLSTEIIGALQAPTLKSDPALSPKLTPADTALVTALYQLTESLFDVRTVVEDLVRTKPVGYHTFTAVGRLLNQSIERSGCRLAAQPEMRTLKPEIQSEALRKLLLGLSDLALRQDLRHVFSSFYRFLRYLDFIQDDLRQDRPSKARCPFSSWYALRRKP